MADALQDLRDRCDKSCWEYAQVMLPHYAFGEVHKQMFIKMGQADRLGMDPNLLFLIPRDHLKSVCLAVYATWRVAKNPCYTILYITADEDLGKLQMAFMQQIFESDTFRMMYPDHFIPEEGRRDKWTTSALNTDHPLRKKWNIRDDTISVKTIKSGKTGRHPDEIMYDDLVVPENAYSNIGRAEVRRGAAQAVSLAKTNALMTAVGTRYHLADQYQTWSEASYPIYSDDGQIIEERPLWTIFERKVEDIGNGLGNFLWPRVFSPDTGDWYGWDIQTLARKKAEYQSNGQATAFAAQYYMEPNDPDSYRLQINQFVYINPRKLQWNGENWEYNGKKLAIVAGMDVATTDIASKTAKRADFTAIAVVGQCAEGFYYVLDIDMFKTDKRRVYASHLIDLWKKWRFRRAFVEMDGSGKIVADGIKDIIREEGLSLIIEGHNAPRDIAKFERHASILIPKYEQGIVYHTEGGYTAELEEQVIKPRPLHDDVVDAVTIAVEKSLRPSSSSWHRPTMNGKIISAHGRFGGRVGR